MKNAVIYARFSSDRQTEQSIEGRMLKDSEKNAWDYVIVYKLDRFSRDKYETAIHRHTQK